MRVKRTNRESGVVLIAVMWGVFVLTAMALALSTLVRSSTEELRARKEQMQAYYVARGAVYKAITTIITIPPPNTLPVFVPGQRKLMWKEDDTDVTVEVMDESGKLDLNAASPETLERLFMGLGMEYLPAHALVAAVEDWRDPDSDARLNGAEEGYYTMLPQPYRPANQDFRSVEELLLVRGVTPDMFYGRYVVNRQGNVERRLGLLDCLTVESHTGAVNINYAPYPVLMAIPGMDSRLAGYMMEGREQRPFKSLSDFTHEYPVMLGGEMLGHLGTAPSGRYSLVASGITRSGVTARVQAVVQVGGFVLTEGQQPPPFHILGWNDSYVR